MLPGLFVTATDTGAGKTAVTAGLTRLWHRQGLRVGVMKPVASGCEIRSGQLLSEDTRQLLDAAGGEQRPELATPIALREPLSPHLAARREGRTLTAEEVRDRSLQARDELLKTSQAILVEGVGGLLTPLADRYTVADLAADLGWPLLVVIEDRLGALNHALLTLEVAARRGLTIAGAVFNRPRPPDYAAAGNAEGLRLATDVPIWGPLPYLPVAPAPEAMADQLAKLNAPWCAPKYGAP